MTRGIIPAHPQRADIEQAIRAGVSARVVARQFGIKNYSTVTLYARKLRARDAEVRTAEAAKSDVNRLIDRLDRLWNLLTTFLHQDDTPGTASKVTIQTIAEARKTVRTIAEIRGLLKPAIQIGVGVNVNTGNGSDQAQRKTPGPDEVKAALFKVLRRHPEARDELVVEFARIQARYDAPVIEHAESDRPVRPGPP